MALSKSEGAGSVRALVRLSGAHLYIQVLGNIEQNGSGGPVTLSRKYQPGNITLFACPSLSTKDADLSLSGSELFRTGFAGHMIQNGIHELWLVAAFKEGTGHIDIFIDHDFGRGFLLA